MNLGTVPGVQGKLWPTSASSRPSEPYTAPPRPWRGSAASSLDIGLQKCTSPYAIARRIKRRRGRGYHRITSGLRLGGDYRLLTLTTSEEACVAGKSIQRSFRALIMRLRRRNLCSGYVRVVEFTMAGRPHYHVILRAPYIAQWFLSQWWAEIHLSPIVDIRAVRRRGGAASYLVKYLGKDDRSRYSWSWDWVWRGFANSWRELVAESLSHDVGMDCIIDMWNTILDAYSAKRLGVQ